MDRFAAMEALVRVVDTGSFSAAARQLGVGQPAVSKVIAQLEERLGVRLLLRSTRGLAPTEAGLVFYERARRSLEEANEADLAATGAGAGLTGRLRFSAAVTFARLHLIPHLPLFREAHPALTIEAILDDRNIDLIEEGVDVAFRMGRLADSAATARRIGVSRRMVLGAPAWFERHGEPLRPADLRGHAAVIYDQGGGGASWTFRRGTEEEAVTLREEVRITAAEGVREAVFAGMGLCVASEWMFQPDLDQGRVRQVMKDWVLPSIDLWAVFPTGRQASAKARAFAGFVAERIGKTGFAP
ncbi:MAG TPA: LysR family transcriptional regulator [Paraburkholderia sp.]|nr:LysR family transcriptional regulator [Paraburkholderia sp.]